MDEIGHILWRIHEEPAIRSITELFRNKVPVTYIADGHHRAASAAKVSQQMGSTQSAKYFLTTIFPASELKILDYNRVVKDLNGLSTDELLKKIEIDFTVEKAEKGFSFGSSLFGFIIDNRIEISEPKQALISTYKDSKVVNLCALLSL